MSRRSEFSEDSKKQVRTPLSNPANYEKQKSKGKSKHPWSCPRVTVDSTSDEEEEQVRYSYFLLDQLNHSRPDRIG
jgi:hypothetical protein